MMIEKLGHKGKIDAVQYLLQQMKLEGISVSEDIFISMIRSYRSAEAAEQALKTFYRIQEFGCKPTVRIYNFLLDALLSENRFLMINPVYGNIKKDGLEPNVYTYNILLKALCKNNSLDGARMLLVEMSNKGCEPDKVSYTTIISVLCKQGKVKEAWDLVLKFIPTVSVYNALINGYCKDSQERLSLKRPVDLFKEAS